jgi:aspartate dehydrogenase
MSKVLKVGISGFGTIGKVIGKALDDGISGLELVGITSGSAEKAKHNMIDFSRPVPVLSADEMINQADIKPAN